jgi:TAT-translocated FGD2 family F420-dependent dehydrogenase
MRSSQKNTGQPGGITRRQMLAHTGAMIGASMLPAATLPLRLAPQRTQAQAAGDAVNREHTIGYVLSTEQWRVSDLLNQAIAAEAAGFDMVWSSDHFHPWQDNEGHSGQAWTLLSAIGQKTSRIFFGTGVTCPTYRYRPAIVAEAFASLAILNPGRVFLGVGTGEALNEQASGGGWGPYAERAERLVEAVQIIRQLWQGDWMSFNGKYYQIPKARLYDVPDQPIPLYIAASGKNSFRLSGLHGDGWITEPTHALNPEDRATWESAARDAGKDPAALPIISELFVFVGSENDPELEEKINLWRFLPKAWTNFVNNPDPVAIEQGAMQIVPIEEVKNTWIVGEDPQLFVKRILALFKGGVSKVFIHSAQNDQQKVLDFFGQQVIPQVRSQMAALHNPSSVASV